METVGLMTDRRQRTDRQAELPDQYTYADYFLPPVLIPNPAKIAFDKINIRQYNVRKKKSPKWRLGHQKTKLILHHWYRKTLGMEQAFTLVDQLLLALGHSSILKPIGR